MKQSRTVGIICCALALALLIVGAVLLNRGFDKKNNYYMNENYSALNENAYVGGDAYNYIINGTYFTGYVTLGGSLFICASFFACAGLYFFLRDRRENEPEPDAPAEQARPLDPPAEEDAPVEIGIKLEWPLDDDDVDDGEPESQ